MFLCFCVAYFLKTKGAYFWLCKGTLCHQVEGGSDQTGKWCDTSLGGRTAIHVLWISARRRELAETTQEGKQWWLGKRDRGRSMTLREEETLRDSQRDGGKSSSPEQGTDSGENVFTWRKNLFLLPLRTLLDPFNIFSTFHWCSSWTGVPQIHPRSELLV